MQASVIKRLHREEVVRVKPSTKAEEESIEQLFAEVEARLAEVDDILLRSLEAKVKIAREVCNNGYKALSRLEQKVIRLELQK